MQASRRLWLTLAALGVLLALDLAAFAIAAPHVGAWLGGGGASALVRAGATAARSWRGAGEQGVMLAQRRIMLHRELRALQIDHALLPVAPMVAEQPACPACPACPKSSCSGMQDADSDPDANPNPDPAVNTSCPSMCGAETGTASLWIPLTRLHSTI